jgi:hypothetical protein
MTSSTKSTLPIRKRETRLWLGMIKAALLPDAAEVADLYAKCEELICILYAILKKSRATPRNPQR